MTSQQQIYIVGAIDNLYLQFETMTTADDRFNCLNNIIEFKKLCNYSRQGSSLYLDLKKYIKYYILAVEDKDSDYDQISIEIVGKKIASVEIKLQIDLFKILKKYLLLHAYIEEASDCDLIIQKLKISYYKKENDLKSWIRLIILWSSISPINLIICLLLFFFITSVFLIDTNIKAFQILNVKLVQYSTNEFLNHLVNTITLFFDFENGMKINANCFTGVVLIVVAKILYILLLVNFVVKKMIDLIKINE